ncbi:keratin, type I cytoskeletal 9 [Anastrepha ludens]|uniref:keratin, type I cytoskeletal 9 n=1 Tax=Anastrepha ludens TaxID=28586 RepID=UPI0023B17268|nr:keratin, type I cytoskeletal 9 [Anastrepha ludens]XP_053949091.1 keratin, type I cytoskeletal 9 [Anastrepha ludens]
MRLFLVFCCALAAVTHAKPQGYNYGTGISGSSSSGSSYQSGGGFVGGLSGLGGLGGLSAPSSHGSFGSASSSSPIFGGFQSGGIGSNFGRGAGVGGFQSGSTGGSFGHSAGAGSFGSGSGSGIGGGFSGIGGGIHGGGASSGFGGQYQQTGGFEAPLVHKQFLTISAPEDHDSLEQSKHFVIGRPQKNYRVVFIKAPSSSAANVKLSAEYAPKEEKTVIYVLSKKDSTLEVNDIATPAPTVPAKPEVFFIKYKTEEEAHHAQQQIQAEYDKIEGTSEHADGGIGQQQSVVGILDGGAGGIGDAGSRGVGGGIGGGVGGSSYASGSGAGIGGISGGSLVGASSSSFGVGQSGSSGAKSPTYLPPSTRV